MLGGVLAAVALVSASGCFKGEFANCKVTCATSADCPGSLECNPQGVCSPGGDMCSAMPDADLSKPQTLTVSTMGDGAVTSDPAGIDCGATCMHDFPPLSSVTLTAAPAGTSVFDGWTGDCAGQAETCSLTMDGPKSATAKFATHGALRFVKQISFSGQDFVGSELAVDSNGDVIATGSIDDQGAPGFYTVKYGKDDGHIIWEKKTIVSGGFFGIGGLTTDSSGNAYMCTRFQGQGAATIGPSTVTGDLFGNVLVVKYAAADGNIEWAKSWGGSAQEECAGIVASGTDIFVTGYTSSNPSNFDSQVLAGSVNNGFVVRAVQSNGQAQQAILLGANFQIYDIAENQGQIAVVGSFTASNYITGSCNFTSTATGTDGFIMNMSSNLVCTWNKTFGSLTANQNTASFAVADVPGGGWAVTGYFEGSVNFAGTGSAVGNQGGRDAFIARYAGNGTHIYSFGYGAAGNDYGRGVDVTPTGEVVFGGEFQNTVTFGATMLTTTNQDVFMTRLSAGNTPTHQWAAKVGGTASEQVQGLKVDAQGTVSVLAYWTGMTDIGGMQLTAADYDAFVGSFVR
ncbi:MAG TPA: hypothetical protein VFV99_29315 [Kofleriaceae bacterium]|nr:hypothetical protein [Kofleriaceae bacterium]